MNGIEFEKFLVIFMLIMFVSGVSITLIGYSIDASKHYWNGPCLDMPLGAPDGIYDVFPRFLSGNNSVFFSVWKSDVGGRLHGNWNFDNSSGFVIFEFNAFGCVRLHDNVIVEAWMK